MDKGNASGIILAEKKNINFKITNQLSPLPAKSSIYNHKNCINKINITTKNVGRNELKKDFAIRVFNFFKR